VIKVIDVSDSTGGYILQVLMKADVEKRTSYAAKIGTVTNAARLLAVRSALKKD
jgi:hypothetical protein